MDTGRDRHPTRNGRRVWARKMAEKAGEVLALVDTWYPNRHPLDLGAYREADRNDKRLRAIAWLGHAVAITVGVLLTVYLKGKGW